MNNPLISAIIFGIACAIIAISIIDIMANEPIINWWFQIGQRVGIYLERGHERERWFYKPLWGCSKCFAGQLALWVFLIWHLRTGSGQHGVIWPGAVWLDGYSLFCHLLAISSAITSAFILSTVIKQKTNE